MFIQKITNHSPVKYQNTCFIYSKAWFKYKQEKKAPICFLTISLPPRHQSGLNEGTILVMAELSKSLTSGQLSHNIRPFNTYSDLTEVADLIELCFAGSLDRDGKRYLQQMRQFANSTGWLNWIPMAPEWAGSPFIGYVCEENGELIGNVSLVPYHIKRKRNYLIANVAVHPDHRRRGIARNLTMQSIEHARQHNAAGVWLNVRDNNQAAIRLYSELGFAERARRATWHSNHEYPRSQLTSDIKLRPRTSSDWKLQKDWLDQNYPPQYCWHLPINYNLLHPGFRGSFSRLFSTSIVHQFSATQTEQLVGVVAWQKVPSRSSYIWLAQPHKCNLSALKTLLIHVQKQIVTRQLIILEYPAGYADDTIQSTGFSLQQTLIWMELNREGSQDQDLINL